MRLAKMFANLAVMAFALSFGPSMGAQTQPAQSQPAQSQPAQKPAPKATPAKGPKASKPAGMKPSANSARPAGAPAETPSSGKPEVVANKRDASQKPAPKAKPAKVQKASKPAGMKLSASSARPAGAPAETPSPEKPELVANKRDPFLPLVAEHKGGSGPDHLPPGKAGLVIGSVHVDGAVKAPNGMIAVVSNPEQRVYFVREGDRLYDGDVEKIGLDGVTFRENSKDAFGHPVERLVTKRIYPSAGEQQ